MAQKLTDAIIRNAEAPGKVREPCLDSEVKGFGIRLFAPTKRNPEGSPFLLLELSRGQH